MTVSVRRQKHGHRRRLRKQHQFPEMREQRVQRRRDRLQHRSARNVRNMEFVGREQTDMRDLTVRTAASAR